jgi:hypothetical protein
LKLEIERKKLEAERKHLEAEKEKFEIAKLPPEPKYSPSVPKPNEIGRNGRFMPYDNGTVKDTRTGLMWAAKDNGEDINWQDAKKYCQSYRGGAYTDWRMPSEKELATIYDPNRSTQFRTSGSINVTANWVWGSETTGSKAAVFDFHYGRRIEVLQFYDYNRRALPVRGGN